MSDNVQKNSAGSIITIVLIFGLSYATTSPGRCPGRIFRFSS
jgi:hypothetical protein